MVLRTQSQQDVILLVRLHYKHCIYTLVITLFSISAYKCKGGQNFVFSVYYFSKSQRSRPVRLECSLCVPLSIEPVDQFMKVCIKIMPAEVTTIM